MFSKKKSDKYTQLFDLNVGTHKIEVDRAHTHTHLSMHAFLKHCQA